MTKSAIALVIAGLISFASASQLRAQQPPPAPARQGGGGRGGGGRGGAPTPAPGAGNPTAPFRRALNELRVITDRRAAVLLLHQAPARRNGTLVLGADASLAVWRVVP